MKSVDTVPTHSHYRSLYLQAAVYICRRVEFIEGYPLDGQQVHLESLVSKRYIGLLERSVRFCSAKIRSARLVAGEYRFFAVHIYTAVYFRFPFATPKLLEAVLQSTEKLEGIVNDVDARGAKCGPSNASSGSPDGVKSGARPVKTKRRYGGSAVGNLRSPRQYRRHWNDLSGTVLQASWWVVSAAMLTFVCCRAVYSILQNPSVGRTVSAVSTCSLSCFLLFPNTSQNGVQIDWSCLRKAGAHQAFHRICCKKGVVTSLLLPHWKLRFSWA